MYLADHFLPPNHGDASEFKRFEEEVIAAFDSAIKPSFTDLD